MLRSRAIEDLPGVLISRRIICRQLVEHANRYIQRQQVRTTRFVGASVVLNL